MIKEARQYAKGKRVKLKDDLSQVYIIAEYDSSIVPPIWLENDPIPHYAHELVLLPAFSYALNRQSA